MNQTQVSAGSETKASAPPSKKFRGRERLKPTSKRNPGQAKLRQPGEPRESYFKPGFTVVANFYLDNLPFRLGLNQEDVFKWVCRFSTGFCREWFRVKTHQALQWTCLKRSPYYKARKELCELEVIEVRADIYGGTWVRLAPSLQPLKPEYISTLDLPEFAPISPQIKDGQSSNEGRAVPDSGTAPNTCMKETLEKITDIRQQQIQNTVNAASSEGSTIDVEMGGTDQELNGFWSQWISDEITPFPALECKGVSEGLSSLPVILQQPDSNAEQAATAEEQPASCNVEKIPPAPSPEDVAAAEQVKLQRQADRRAVTLAKEQKRADRAAKKATEAPVIKTKTASQPELTPEQLANAEALRANGVSVPKDEWLARTKSAAAIARALSEIQLQKDVTNPGGWLFQGLSSGRFDEEAPSAAISATEESEADRVRRAEDEQRRKSGSRHQSGAIVSSAQREADLQAVRDREAARERADRQRRDAETVKEMAALDALTPHAYGALYARAKASLGKLTLPEAAMKGAMLGLLEADKRRALQCNAMTAP